MSNLKTVLKHGKNYMFANIANKALAFISIPIYTRLLSKEEYGIYNVFIASIGIFSVLFTLNSETSISRYFYDKKDDIDFKKFVGTIVQLCFVILLCTSIVFFIFLKPIANLLSFEILLTIAILPVSLYNIINSIFNQIYNPLLKSRQIAIISSIQAYLAFGLSVLFIFLIPEKKYYGLVLGTISAMLLLATYLIRQIKPYFIVCFSTQHIKYSLNYTLPYIPYTLSGVILVQFGRIIISKYGGGFEDAGLYSYAANISSLMLVLISVTHQTWNPYYFEQMNKKNYAGINMDYDIIWRVTLFSAILLSLFGYEIGLLLNDDYEIILYLVPILTLGHVFYQWAYVYMRNVGYAKKTIWNGAAVFISGISNISLNIILVEKYNYIGAAISFSASCLILLLVSYIINRIILKVYAPPFCNFAKILAYVLPFIILAEICYFFSGPYYILLAIKIIVIVVSALIVFFKYRIFIFNKINQNRDKL